MPQENDNKKTTETKIVKVEPKKDNSKDSGASKVQIRAVDVAIIEAQRRKQHKDKRHDTEKKYNQEYKIFY